MLLATLCLSQPAGARSADLGPEEARELERLLAELRFDPGPVDGVIDGRTRTAISLYQEFAALPVNGEPGPELLAELRQVVQAFAEINATKTAVAETVLEPEPEPEVAVDPQPEPEPEVAAQPKPEIEPEPEVVARPDPKPENDTGSLAQAKSGFTLDNLIARLVE